VQQIKPNQEKPIDLVKDFYDQDIDHKALEKALTQRKNTAKGFTNFSLDPYTGEFGDAEKKHLLNRTMVGYCHRHHKDLNGLNLEESIDLIFQEDEFKEPTNIYYWHRNAQEFKDEFGVEDVGPNEPFIDLASFKNEFQSYPRPEIVQHGTYERFYNQKTSIHWKLVLFLHNLIPTRPIEPMGAKSGYNYYKLLFNSCFYSYKDFIYNITLDASMLEYLSLQFSLKDTPDENFAREIQELFTVGKRPFSKFTEKDVREIARALVGWRYDYNAIIFQEGHENIVTFEPWNHDIGDKYFSSFYGNKVIKGKEGEAGSEELQEVVDMLCEPEEHSIYIVRRLYQFFVYPSLTDEIEELIIRPLAQIYRESDFSLIEPLKILLKSQHFFENQIENSLIKPPIEFIIGMIKEVGSLKNGILYQINNDQQKSYNSLFSPNYFGEREKHPDFIEFEMGRNIDFHCRLLGMEIGQPPSVSGWQPYYQEPIYDLLWVNSSSFNERKNIVQNCLIYGHFIGWYNGFPVNLKYNLIEYINTFENPTSLNQFVDQFIFRFLGGEISENIRQDLMNIFGDSENHWEEEINKLIGSSSFSKEEYSSVERRFQNAFKSLSIIGEFQLF